MSQEIAAILDELGARFGATSAELWAELVRYQIAVPMAWAVGLAVVTTLLAVTAMVMASKGARVDDWSPFAAMAALAGVGTTIAGAVLWVTLQAPQAAVIRSLF